MTTNEAHFAYLGFDVSSTGAGAVLLDNEGTVMKAWCWQSDDPSVDARRNSLFQWAFTILVADGYAAPGFTSFSIEAAIFRGKSSANLAKAHGAAQCLVADSWGVYAPQSVKATAHHATGVVTSTGAGQESVGKEPMADAAALALTLSEWSKLATASAGHKDPNKAFGDVIDAYWVARTDMAAVAATRGEG
jgi:hypothetical protein